MLEKGLFGSRKQHLSGQTSDLILKIWRSLPLLILFNLMVSAVLAQSTVDYNFQIWFRTTTSDSTFKAIATNKDWNTGEIVDFTSNHNFGQSRSSGALKGWAIALQPNGSWTWNIGDGEKRLDYLPTAKFQPINDGKLHFLAFSINFKERAAWLYYDGIQVAIYSLDELSPSVLNLENYLGPVDSEEGFAIEIINVKKGFLSPLMAQSLWVEKVGKSPSPKSNQLASDSSSLNVISWNIWHGGRRDGIQEGLGRTINILKANQPDIICMQETYGSGPIIADHLGQIYYYRSSNLSVFSKYPILETHGLFEPFRFGGVTLQLPNGQKIRAFSLWINHLPGVNEMVRSAKNEKSIIRAEMKTRGTEIKNIVKTLPDLFADKDSIPLIIGGDFNSPSHLDWQENTESIHRNLVVNWPVSKHMEKSGFSDAFRIANPDPLVNYGRTWSPKFTEVWQDRIDYIYYTNGILNCTEAKMLDQWDPQWPSDHAAVWSRFMFSNSPN